MSERKERRAWPCSVAVGLAKPGPTHRASGDAGRWLVSKSPGELSIEVIGNGATVKLGIGDAELAAVPLERGRFAFALVSEALLAGCAAGPTGLLTFSCSFFTPEHAADCASLMAAWLCPGGDVKVPQAGPVVETAEGNVAERLLLQTIALGDPEGAGMAWWPDFADFVGNIERQWDAAAGGRVGSRPL